MKPREREPVSDDRTLNRSTQSSESPPRHRDARTAEPTAPQATKVDVGEVGSGVGSPPGTVSTRSGAVFNVGLLLGIVGDALLRGGGAPGLNLFLWAAALTAAVFVLERRREGALSKEAATLLGVGVFFAAVLAWRDSPPLKVIALAATAGAFALPALEAGAAWIRRAGVSGYAHAAAGASFYSGLGTLFALNEVDWGAVRSGSAHSGRWRRARAVARGLAISVPLLLVFGGLFIAADPVFARIASTARVDLDQLAQDVFLVAFFGWVATGYLYGFLTGTRLPSLPAQRRPSIGMTEGGVALGLLALLFAVFVAVQFRYLFGGASMIEVTPGLTYSEYARRGFFELVAASALMVPVLLAADWLVVRERARDESIFRALAAVQILLLFAVMGSALQRMRLYQEAYGLTEQRFYATSFLIWIAVVLFWLAWTVLRGRRRSFAFGALVSAFVAAAMLVVINPDAVIARTNLARAESGAQLDAAYTASLSGDAVPVLLPALAELPSGARCRIARRLLDRWPPDARSDWRSWSLSDARARAAVREHATALRRAAGTAEECPS